MSTAQYFFTVFIPLSNVFLVPLGLMMFPRLLCEMFHGENKYSSLLYLQAVTKKKEGGRYE